MHSMRQKLGRVHSDAWHGAQGVETGPRWSSARDKSGDPAAAWFPGVAPYPRLPVRLGPPRLPALTGERLLRQEMVRVPTQCDS
jgi:hypothetical protein